MCFHGSDDAEGGLAHVPGARPRPSLGDRAPRRVVRGRSQPSRAVAHALGLVPHSITVRGSPDAVPDTDALSHGVRGPFDPEPLSIPDRDDAVPDGGRRGAAFEPVDQPAAEPHADDTVADGIADRDHAFSHERGTDHRRDRDGGADRGLIDADLALDPRGARRRGGRRRLPRAGERDDASGIDGRARLRRSGGRGRDALTGRANGEGATPSRRSTCSRCLRTRLPSGCIA